MKIILPDSQNDTQKEIERLTTHNLRLLPFLNSSFILEFNGTFNKNIWEFNAFHPKLLTDAELPDEQIKLSVTINDTIANFNILISNNTSSKYEKTKELTVDIEKIRFKCTVNNERTKRDIEIFLNDNNVPFIKDADIPISDNIYDVDNNKLGKEHTITTSVTELDNTTTTTESVKPKLRIK